MNKIEALM